jgi:hypothetical protein
VCLTAVAVLGWVFGAVGAASALTITFALQAVAIVVGFAVLVMRHQGDGTPGDLTDPELTDEEGELEP